MRISAALISTLATCLALAAVAHASVLDRPYDFTDAYYRANGIDPAKLGGRKQAPSNNAVIDFPNFSWQRNVRVISTSGGYNASGDVQFFVVLAGFAPDGFTNDKAGRNAKVIADKYAEYIFPSRGSDPVGLGGGRQSALHDTRNGYFSNDPLGLWLHVWVNYTDKAFNTRDGQKALADLTRKNGLAKDGTPFINSASDIDNLFDKGFVTKLTRNDALRYAVCPEIRDPRDGGIAPDAFFNPALRPDGTLLEPDIYNAFHSLQNTGNWPNH